MLKKSIATLRNHSAFFVISSVFFVLYALISLLNHYFFRTYALDLGLYTNALYDYAHFRFNYSEVFKDHLENLLSDHFDLFLMLVSPFYYLFGTYTLLIVQIIFIHIGAAGIYKNVLLYHNNKRIALIVTSAFMIFYGVFSALAFDYHSNVIASMLVPWLFYFFQKQHWKKSFFCVLLILITKENMALWAGFICIGLFLLHFKEPVKKKYASLFCAFSFLYFISVVQFIMPALSSGGKYVHADYHYFGNNFSEVISGIISNPLKAIKALFLNHSGDVRNNNFKAETYVFVLLSGGLVLLIDFRFLLMLVPIFLQKMYHDNPVMWTVSRQYNIEFAPIISLCIIVTLVSIKKNKLKIILSSIFLALSIVATIRLGDNTYCYMDRNSIRLYQDGHYQSHYQVSKVYAAMKMIPPEAAVSAQSMFLPHLSLRDKIYQYPMIKDANYIIVSLTKRSYPLNPQQLTDSVIQLQHSSGWETMYSEDNVFIFRKK